MFNLKFQFDLTIKVTPKTATLKLNGESRKLNNGQHTEKVAQGAKLVIEMDHHDYEKEEHTIQMGDRDMVEEYELVSCQKLQNCKPNWSAWGPWKECVPRCYNDYSKRMLSTKERTRYYLPDSNYLQDDWEGKEKDEESCSNIPKCRTDYLKKVEVKNSDQSYNTNDDFFLRICNPASCCEVELDSNSNDFQYGNLDTFSGYEELNYNGNCWYFNITVVSSISIKRTPSSVGNEENWLGSYINLISYSITYQCPLNGKWIYADWKWYDFYNCNKL